MRVPEKFARWQKPLSLCSWDKEHGRALIDWAETAADFDAVKDACAQRLGLLVDRPLSADALFLDEGDQYVLVEFKSGGVSPKEILGKIYDSAIILADEMNLSERDGRTDAAGVHAALSSGSRGVVRLNQSDD